MARNYVSLAAGDQGNRVAYPSSHSDLRALAMFSGDCSLAARAGAIRPAPRQTARPSIRTQSRRMPRCGLSRSRSRQARFSPYPVRGVKLDLRRSVLQQRLAFGNVTATSV
uniref:Chromosome 11 open reading frame 71 n=1 Tax=Ictidomys tridecemlineatus TaxID=43179 RepID=A0A287DDQ8_ICTTR